MKLDAYLNEVLEILLSSQNNSLITAQEMIHCLDLTLLDEQASDRSLTQLKLDAEENHVAAVCVYPQHLSHFQSHGIELANVINFPEGTEELSASLKMIEQAFKLGATEIDYVLPYRLYLSGEKQKALDHCKAVIDLCKKFKLSSKIILESGIFPEMQEIYEVSKSLINLGCDFLKTSTGKVTQGASLPAVFTMLSAIKDSNKICGIKISGGVKTEKQALNYAKLAELMMNAKIDKSWFRLGASSLLAELKIKN